MSIASEISRLTTLRNNIRTKLIALGIISDASANLASCYTGLNAVTRKDAATYTPTTTDQTIASGQYLYGAQTISGDANLIGSNIKNGVSIFGVHGSYAPSVVTQEKSVTPSTVQQVVTPDSGKYLSKVTVGAAPLETKSVSPSGTAQEITPSTGQYGLAKVNIAAAVLEAISVTPSQSQQVITPGSGKYGISKVTVAAVTPVPLNGSLIEVTCSSNVDTVTATVNGNTYTAYKVGNIAYVTIPYSDTTSARTCVLKGYSNGSQVTSSNVAMAAGVGYYTAELSTSEWLYDNGTWFGLSSPATWTETSGRGIITETANSIILSMPSNDNYFLTFILSPTFDMRGYSNFEVVYSVQGAIIKGSGHSSPSGSFMQMSGTGGKAWILFDETSTTITNIDKTSTNGTGSATNTTFQVRVHVDMTKGYSTTSVTIHSIKFV